MCCKTITNLTLRTSATCALFYNSYRAYPILKPYMPKAYQIIEGWASSMPAQELLYDLGSRVVDMAQVTTQFGYEQGCTLFPVACQTIYSWTKEVEEIAIPAAALSAAAITISCFSTKKILFATAVVAAFVWNSNFGDS